MNNPTVFIVTGVKKNFPGVSVLSMVYTMQDAIKVIVETLKGEGHVAAVTMLFTDIEIGGDAWVYEDWAWNIDKMEPIKQVPDQPDRYSEIKLEDL